MKVRKPKFRHSPPPNLQHISFLCSSMNVGKSVPVGINERRFKTHAKHRGFARHWLICHLLDSHWKSKLYVPTFVFSWRNALLEVRSLRTAETTSHNLNFYSIRESTTAKTKPHGRGQWRVLHIFKSSEGWHFKTAGLPISVWFHTVKKSFVNLRRKYRQKSCRRTS